MVLAMYVIYVCWQQINSFVVAGVVLFLQLSQNMLSESNIITEKFTVVSIYYLMSFVLFPHIGPF